MRMTQEEWEKSVRWIAIVAGCVIKHNGKYLLVQEKQAKAYGLWNLPAGHVDKGETAEQAAVREAKEESGYDVELDELIDIQHPAITRPLLYAYRAHIIGGELKIQQDEILDVRWMSFDEVKQLQALGKLRADWVFDVIDQVESVA